MKEGDVGKSESPLGWNFPFDGQKLPTYGLTGCLAAPASVSFHAGSQDDKVRHSRSPGIGLCGLQIQILSSMDCWESLKCGALYPGETLTAPAAGLTRRDACLRLPVHIIIVVLCTWLSWWLSKATFNATDHKVKEKDSDKSGEHYQ